MHFLMHLKHGKNIGMAEKRVVKVGSKLSQNNLKNIIQYGFNSYHNC